MGTTTYQKIYRENMTDEQKQKKKKKIIKKNIEKT